MVPIKENSEKRVIGHGWGSQNVKNQFGIFYARYSLEKMFSLNIDTFYANASKLNSVKEM